MVLPLVFLSLLCGAIALGWQAGTRADRQLIVLIATGALATFAVELFFAPSLIVVAVLGIDLTLLGIVWRFALTSKKHWPIWFAGLQLTVVVIGTVSLCLPLRFANALGIIGAFWIIPAVGAMTAGLLMDQQKNVQTA